MNRLVTVQWRAVAGNPVATGGVTVTPWSRALTIRLPFGGFVWNRPTAVVVERAGRIERIPVRDVTRDAQLGLIVLALLLVIVRIRRAFPRKEKAT